MGSARQHDEPFELSVVIPCLNEADTLGICLEVAQRALLDHGIKGEIVVADNGSTDGSQEIAKRSGARVVCVPERGYGSALMGGIAAARGRYVVMGDADGSYDFGEIPQFLAKLREGFDLVLGCRLRSGGGRILDGAMPPLHRWIGNPLFSRLARHWFRAPIHDVCCGLRGFSADHYRRLEQRCVGMEFATEMIVNSSLRGARIAEVPITLHPDGRRTHAPHLKTFRDGWRTLRFLLLYSPRWLFLLPGLLLAAFGFIGYALVLPGLQIGRVRFDAHTLLLASLAVICGYQSVLFAIFTKAFGIREGFLPNDTRLERFGRFVRLEYGLLAGALAAMGGVALLIGAFSQWRAVGFGDLDYSRTMRWVIPGVTLTTLGFQTLLSSFFLSILAMAKR